MSAQPSIPTPAIPEHFDYRGTAQEIGISDTDLGAIIRIFEADYPHDLMLRELHILRACNAVARGAVTIREMLASPGSQAA